MKSNLDQKIMERAIFICGVFAAAVTGISALKSRSKKAKKNTPPRDHWQLSDGQRVETVILKRCEDDPNSYCFVPASKQD